MSLSDPTNPSPSIPDPAGAGRARQHEAETLNEIAQTIAADLDLQSVVQKVTDAGTQLTGAQFGAFFYNVSNDSGESYQLYTLSGAPREAFEKFGLPRNTAVFGPTFRGEGVVRSGDIQRDPRYGHHSPHHGLPKGHPPVRSYLAVPVIARDGAVLGGLFFGHAEPNIFTESAERIIRGISAHAAIALDNARLYGEAQKEIAERKRAEIALARLTAESNKRRRLYEAILSHTPDLAYVFDLGHRFIYANERLLSMWGKSWDQAIGKTCLELGYEAWHAALHDREIDQVIATRSPIRGEVPFTGTFGRRVYDYIFVPIFGADGQVEAIAGTSRDVTDRAATDDLRGRLAAVVESSADAIVSKDLNGVIQTWNKAAERLFGYSAAEAIGQPVTILIPPDHIDEEPHILERIRRGERIENYETVRRRKDGGRLDISLTVSPILDIHGRVIGASKIARDITEQNRARTALHHAQEQSISIINYAPIGIYLVDAQLRIRQVNAKALPVFGRIENLVGRDLREVLHSLWPSQTAEELVGHFQNTLSTGEPHIDSSFASGRLDRPAHEHYEWHIHRITFPGGQYGVVCYFIDISAHILTQRKIDAARQEAEDANRAKDTFLATLSHEIRTPLNAILGWADILNAEAARNQIDREEFLEGLEVIERNARVQAQLIEDVLDVSRIVSGKLQLEMAPCDLREIIGAALDVVRSAADAKRITLTSDLDPNAARAFCDPNRMQQVFWNLLSNAIKFTPSKGKVTVRLSRDRSAHRIEVIDSGQGIEAEFLPYVFDRFRQAEGGSKRRFGGLGLGLSIVRHLVELHGGTVTAQSDGANRGSTFAVLLPIPAVHEGNAPVPRSVEPERESREKKEIPQAASKPSAPRPVDRSVHTPIRLDGLRVLVVDDEPDARRLIAKVLSDAGAAVTTAGGAAEALQRIARHDLLVSDLGMPEADGFDLIRALRSAGHTPQSLPAIALTAFAQKADEHRALEAGFQLHLPKPVDPRRLLATVSSLAENRT
jgi:PAS domain S-box-containing protein